eukprot:g8422.t1
MSSSEEEEWRCLGDARENETIGAARERKKTSPEGQGRTDGTHTPTEDTRSGGVEELGRGARRPRDESSLSWQTPGGSVNLGTAAPATSTTSRGSLKGKSKKITSLAGSREEKGASSAAPSRKQRESRASKKGPGTFGIRVGWSAEDFDYDDSEDETYIPPLSRNASSAGGGGAPHTRKSARGVGAGSATSATRAREELNGGGGVNWMAELSTEVVLNGIIRPYLSSVEKCRLQRTCKDMRRLVDTPEAWETLDLRADVIGRRTMKSGRLSVMSRQPLFFLARSVVQQPRFSLLKTADCQGLNLGAMGSSPDLLLTLFDSCRHIITLNLWKAYVEDERLPQPDSSVEKVIAQHLPGLQNLAMDIDASNQGLKVLLQGCSSLKSLHIGSRRNRRGDSVSMYPNDLGMKVFTTIGAPCLETLSLVDKINVGAAGLRCLLGASACPRLKTLILIKTGRVNDHCLKAIAPSMGRLLSLTLDQCPITPPTVKFVLEKCPELTNLVVSSQRGLVDSPRDGRLLLKFLLAQCPTKRPKIDIQRVAPRGALPDLPRWLMEDFALYTAVAADKRIVIGPANTSDERIAPFMADSTREDPLGFRQHHRDLSLNELTTAAARHGMELIPPEEWMESRRRLQYAGSNCWDVVVEEPHGICDGEYNGEGDREAYTTLRGPTLFTATCFEGDCGEGLSALNRRMFMARAFKCEDGQTVDCPKDEVWGIYSAITNSTSGENELGFLRAWANDALHPADVTSQWWTFQYTSLDEEDADKPRECEHPDCLIPQPGVSIECSSPNWTLPPGMTPVPTMAPLEHSPAPVPGGSVSSSVGSFENSADLDGATKGVTRPFWFAAGGGGGVWQRVGIVAMAAGWWAVGHLV